MKTKLLLLVVSVAAFSSCTTMYKTGQTPDDVYYSPARLYGETQQEDKDEVRKEPVNNYNNEDRIIMMGIYDSRWRYLNNDYDYSPYYHTFYNSQSFYGNYFPNYSKFYYNDYYYNPYYCANPVYITHVNPIKNTTPRVTNLYGYGKNHNNTNTPLTYIPGVMPSAKYNKTNSSRLGNILNDVLSPNQSFNQFNQTNTSNRNTSNNSTTERTYTPAPSSTSSSSGSSSSGVKITRKD